MTEIASAFVTIAPSAKGFGSSLNKQVSPGVKSTGSSIGKTFGKMFVLGASVIAAAGIGRLLSGSIEEAREAQKVGAATEQIIKATGGAARITAEDVGAMASRLSAVTGIDDEAIQTGSNLLLTFKNVRNYVDGKFSGTFDRATAAAVDLSAAGFGSIESASKTMGKALNDPIKGVSALSRAGVTFTDQQKKQIETMVESGDVLGAQNIILKEVEGQVGGVAAATATSGEKAKVAFGNIKEAIGTALLPVVDRLADAFVKLSPLIQDGISRIGPFISDIVGAIKPVIEKVRDNIASVLGEIPPLLSAVVEKAKPVIANLRDTIASVADKIGPAFTTAKNVAKQALTKLSELGDLINFEGMVGPLADGLKSAKKSAEKLAESLGGLDFKDLDASKLGENLGTAMADAVKTFIDLSGTITKTLGKMFKKVDWVGLGITIGKQVPAMLLGLVVGILNFDLMGLLEGIKDHWGEILIGLLTVAFAPAKLAGPLVKILGKIPFVGKFLAAAVKWLNDLGGKLLSFGGDLLKSMWKGFTGGGALPGAGIILKVLAALKGLPGKVKDFIVKLQVRLGVWALNAFEAIGRGARTAIGKVISFTLSIPGRILRSLGSLLKLLWPKGHDLIQGLLRAIRDKFDNAITFVKGIPGKVLDALGSLGSTLYNAGKALIQGLIDGIKAMAKPVGDAMGKVADVAGKFWPGSPIREGPLKSWNNGGAGKRLVALLAEGMGDIGPVERATRNLADAVRMPSPTASRSLARRPRPYQSAPEFPGFHDKAPGGVTIRVDKLMPHDYRAFMGDMQRQSQRAALGGFPS